MQGPADTLNYMIAAYAVIFTVMIVYLASLVIRWRNLRQDQEMLKHLEEAEDEGESKEKVRDVARL